MWFGGGVWPHYRVAGPLQCDWSQYPMAGLQRWARVLRRVRVEGRESVIMKFGGIIIQNVYLKVLGENLGCYVRSPQGSPFFDMGPCGHLR